MNLPKLISIYSEYRTNHVKISQFICNDITKKTDFDVFLEDKGENLQRKYVWNKIQQEEYIKSILYRRFVPPIVYFEYVFPFLKKDFRDVKVEDISTIERPKYQIIDGKQRLLTHISYINNDFQIDINNKYFYYKGLPIDYKNSIMEYEYIGMHKIFSYYSECNSDEKIKAMINVNFAGTPQDKEHFEKLSALL